MLIGTINSVQYLNGSIQGIQGATGNGIASIVLNNDYTLTVNYTDGTSYTTGSIRGATGKTGATPSLSIGNVITGEAGSDAEATITGTDTNPVLNLTLPRGETGNVSLEQLYALAIKQSISGEIASFSDGGDNLPMPKCEVSIDPIQDLHGYDAPWVGGAGKNKFSGNYFSGDVSTRYLDFFGGHSATGAFKDNGISVKASTTYAVSISFPTTPDGNWGVYGAYTESTTTITFSANASGSTRTFTFTPTTDTKVVFWGYIGDTWAQHNVSTIDGIKVQVEQGSTATAWTPYENICPISGWDGCEVAQSGINIVDSSNAISGLCGYHAGDDINTVVAKTRYSHSKLLNAQDGLVVTAKSNNVNTFNFVGISVFDEGGNWTKTYSESEITDTSQTVTVSCPANTHRWARLFYGAVGGYSVGTNIGGQVQCEVGTTAHDYEPYTGQSYNTPLGQTVYGGTLDLVSGELTVTQASITLVGSADENWTQLNNKTNCVQFGITPSPSAKAVAASAVANALSNCFTIRSENDVYNNDIEGISLDANGRIRVMILKSRLGTANVTGFKTWLGSNSTQVVYELATPTTYQLTPQQIQTLLGTNNVWANSGDVEVVYIADTKLYVDNH